MQLPAMTMTVTTDAGDGPCPHCGCTARRACSSETVVHVWCAHCWQRLPDDTVSQD